MHHHQRLHHLDDEDQRVFTSRHGYSPALISICFVQLTIRIAEQDVIIIRIAEQDVVIIYITSHTTDYSTMCCKYMYCTVLV